MLRLVVRDDEAELQHGELRARVQQLVLLALPRAGHGARRKVVAVRRSDSWPVEVTSVAAVVVAVAAAATIVIAAVVATAAAVPKPLVVISTVVPIVAVGGEDVLIFAFFVVVPAADVRLT